MPPARRPLASTAVIAAALAIGAAARPARAQPPGQTTPWASMTGSPYHAVAPLPRQLHSPLPSLPPPSQMAPPEGSTGRRTPSAGGGYVIYHPGFTAVVGADGSIHFDDDSLSGDAGVSPVFGPIATAHFDITDMVMRGLHQDPYLADKLHIMDATRPERMALRARHDQVVMRRALGDLPRYLAAVWAQEEWSPATRRRILFALWDETAESGNQLVREGGAQARLVIEHFIARRLPAGSPDAFRPGELAALNRVRTSHQRFAPYGADPHSDAPTRVARRDPPRAAPPRATRVAALALRGL